MVLFPHRNMIPHQSTCLPVSSRVGPWGFQRERWWLLVPCISSGGYIQVSASWHSWSVRLSARGALLSDQTLRPGLPVGWGWLLELSVLVLFCLTLHIAAAVSCHGECPVSSILSGACVASCDLPAPKWGSCVFQQRTLAFSNIYSGWLFLGVSFVEQ